MTIEKRITEIFQIFQKSRMIHILLGVEDSKGNLSPNPVITEEAVEECVYIYAVNLANSLTVEEHRVYCEYQKLNINDKLEESVKKVILYLSNPKGEDFLPSLEETSEENIVN